MSEERGQGNMLISRERDRVRGSRELSGPGLTEAAGVGLIRRHKAGFEAEIQGWFFLTDRMQFSYLRWSIEVLERREFRKVSNQTGVGPLPV